MNTYIVEGGIGKAVAFSAIIDALVKKDGEQIQVHTPYPEVFANNPNVKWVFPANQIAYGDERITSAGDIKYCEPYKSNYLKGNEHLIETYCKLLGVKYSKKMRPKVYTEYLIEEHDKVKKEQEISDNYMIVQFTGGQPPMDESLKTPYQSGDPGRNYPYWMAQQVVNMLKEDNPDRQILFFGLPNEPQYQNAHKTFMTNFGVWHELLKNAEGFIGIDSSLQHMSQSAKTNGVVLWGSTRFNQLGYSENTNINFHMKDVWIESKFNSLDPRNIMVDPTQVVDLYKGKLND